MLAENGSASIRRALFRLTAVAVAASSATIVLSPPPLLATEPSAAAGATAIQRASVEVVSVEPIPFRRLTVRIARQGERWQRKERVQVGGRTVIAVPPGRWRFKTVARTTNHGVKWKSNTAITRIATHGLTRVRLTVRPKRAAVQAVTAPPDGRLGELFTAVNTARSTARHCGSRWKPAAPPVRYNAELAQAADEHATDMAARNYFAHLSPEGRDFVSRIRRAGYAGEPGGENLAMGFADATSVVAGWLDSPGHCENLMEPAWTEMGLGYAEVRYPGYTSLFTYWVQEFGWHSYRR